MQYRFTETARQQAPLIRTEPNQEEWVSPAIQAVLEIKAPIIPHTEQRMQNLTAEMKTSKEVMQTLRRYHAVEEKREQ